MDLAAVALSMIIAVAACHSQPRSKAPALFSYVAGDGQHAASFQVNVDGTWESNAHDGIVERGKLKAPALERFRALVSRAPFLMDSVPCPDPNPESRLPKHWVRYHDRVGNRSARSEERCGETVDEETRNLPACLRALAADRGDVARWCTTR